MRIKLIAAVTAISIIAGITANFPANADNVTLSYAPYVQNMMNITVKDTNDNFIEDAQLELIDPNGKDCYKFTVNTDSGSKFNGTEVEIVPFDDNKNLIKVDTDILKGFIPAENDSVKVTYTSSHLKDGCSEEFTIYHCDQTIPSVLTVPSGTISIYADDAVASKKANGYITVDDVKYYFKDSTEAENNIIHYPISGVADKTMFGVEYPGVGSSAGSNSIEPMKYETEYVKYRIHISELSERFNVDGTYTLPADVNGSGSPITFDLQNDDYANYSAFMIKSGAVINAVLPDSNGYIEFYVEKASRRYDLNICTSYSYKTDHNTTSKTSRYYGKTLYYADITTVTVTAPDFPETGTSFMHVPAGEYTLKFSQLPVKYKDPGEIKIKIADVGIIQDIKIILEKSYTLGDVNENGQIDISDATLSLREYALETAMLDSELTPTQKLAADVNEDGVIDMSDVTKILKYYAYTLAAIEVDPETIFKQ